MKNVYCEYKGKTLPKNNIGGSLHDSFYIKKNKELIENNIYLVLRPDKDEKANLLFPGNKVVYLRYDKPEDLIMIEKYKNSL